MRFIVFAFLLVATLSFSGCAFAYEPKVIGTPGQHDVLVLPDPEIEKFLYGELKNHPHMYEVRSSKDFHLSMEILMPHEDETLNNISGIILEVLPTGRVKEVARLHAKDSSWSPFYEPWGGDSYRRGPGYEGDLKAGTYRIEMSTPDNIGKYIFVLGTEENPDGLGYFEKIGEIGKVKVFLGKPWFAIVGSPYVYIPLLIIALAVAGFTVRRKMKRI